MSKVTLIEASPWVAVDGSTATVRLAGGGQRGYNHLSHTDWKAGVATQPRFTVALPFSQDGLTGGEAIPQVATIRFYPSDPAVLTTMAGYYWIGAPVTVKTGDDATASPTWTTEITGTVAAIDTSSGVLELTIADLGAALAVPVITARFVGSGATEGDADAAQRIKRRSWGRVFNVEGRVLDKANNIYEFGDLSFKWQSIDEVRDKGRAGPISIVAWAGSVGATLTALIAATPPAGGGSVAPSIACVKWWTDAAGPLCCDAHGEIGAGYVETAPAIAAAMLTALSSVTITNTAAMVTARPEIAGLHAGDENETIASALDRLLSGSGLVWPLDPAGTITLRQITFSSPAETLTSLGAERVQAFKPVKARRLGYKRNELLHSAGDVSAILLEQLNLQGIFDRDLIPNNGAEGGSTFGWVQDDQSGTDTDVTLTVTDAEKKSGSNAFRITKSATTKKAGFGSFAGPVQPGKTYFVGASVKGGSATALGLYVRVSWSDTSPGVNQPAFASMRDGNYDIVSNGPVPSAWTDYADTWTCPAGIYWASLVVYNWASGPTVMDFDDVYFSLTQPNADNTAANASVLHNPVPTGVVTIEQDSDGAVRGGQYNVVLPFTFQQGNSDLTILTDWAIVSRTGTLTSGNCTINNTGGSSDRGKVTITGGLGVVTVSAQYNNGQVLTASVELRGHPNAAPSTTSTSALANVTSTSNNTVQSVIEYTPTGTSITVQAAGLTFRSDVAGGAGDANLKLKHQLSTTSHVAGMSDIAGFVTGNPQTPGSATKGGWIPGSDGSITCNQQKTGLAPGVKVYINTIGQATAAPSTGFPVVFTGGQITISEP